jgi:hypothetical protein
MFEKPLGREEKDRSRMIMIVSGAAVLAVIALVIVVTQYVKPAAPVDMERVYAVYDPETEQYGVALPCPPQNVAQTEAQSYVQNIKFDVEKATGEYPNLNSKYARISGTVKNAGDRTIAGLQLRMVVYINECELVREKVVTVIPEKKGSLGPGESLSIDMSVDRTPDKTLITHMRIEPYGLKLK